MAEIKRIKGICKYCGVDVYRTFKGDKFTFSCFECKQEKNRERSLKSYLDKLDKKEGKG